MAGVFGSGKLMKLSASPSVLLSLEKQRAQAEQEQNKNMATKHPASVPTTHQCIFFIDLPREIRDKIYEYSRTFSWIDIANMPTLLLQPDMTKVSRLVRDESLDIFYGRNRFMLDCRGHKHASYGNLTQDGIFNAWITAIGNKNTARLRFLSFYVYNFAVHLTITPPGPSQPTSIAIRFKQTRYGLETADDVIPGYTFKLAIGRAEAFVRHSIEVLLEQAGTRPLGTGDVIRLGQILEAVKPALCTRNGVGWKGALLGEDPSVEPDVARHLASCAECRYVRPVRE